METETFLVSSQPASSANLAVSEVNYRPGVPTPAEIALGFDVRTDFEYLEVMNISAVDVDLAGVQFTTGVQFEFDLGEVPFLSPGERVLIVSNRSAFEQRYAPQLSGFRIAGEFTNNLSNDGETVILSTGGGTDIRNFTYNDVAPWPGGADGSGRSLVLRNPANDPDHNLPGNWRASSSPNGSPGTEDLTGGYADWAALNFTPAELADPLVSGPEADPDEDGLNNLAECYFHGNPSTPDPSPGVIGEHNGLLSLTFTRRTGASAHTDLQLYSSTDLVTWNADTLAEIATIVDNGDGSETVTLASSEVPSTRERLFLRIQLSLKE
jgi:hypothetical protein